jgi:hypothetical protein
MFEKTAFRFVLDKGDRDPVLVCSFPPQAETAAKVGPRRVEPVVAAQVEEVDLGQAGRWAADFGQCHGAVEGDNGRRHLRQQLVVQRKDLDSVRRRGGGRVSVYGVDGRLKLIGPRFGCGGGRR